MVIISFLSICQAELNGNFSTSSIIPSLFLETTGSAPKGSTVIYLDSCILFPISYPYSLLNYIRTFPLNPYQNPISLSWSLIQSILSSAKISFWSKLLLSSGFVLLESKSLLVLWILSSVLSLPPFHATFKYK